MRKPGRPQDARLLAVSTSDLHLSAKPPLARSCEKDWLGVQAGYLDQLSALTYQKTEMGDLGDSVDVHIPLLIAGDIFDKWNAPAEIITTALCHLPPLVYGIPGNHDLPNHRLAEMDRSAYGTLMAAGRIINLPPGEPLEVHGGAVPFRLWGYPCGVDVVTCPDPHDLYLDIAVIHDYIWTDEETSYPDAPGDKRYPKHLKKLAGYDIALYGDNHIHFSKVVPDTITVWNNGGFQRRKRDEMDNHPCVGLVYSDGSVVPHFLDVSKDQFVEAGDLDVLLDGIGGNSFVEALLELGDAGISFADAVWRVLEREKVGGGVKDFVRRAMGEV